MTRGLRKRPLIEPEYAGSATADNGKSDVIDHRQDRNLINGKFAPGNKAAVGRRTPIPFEVLLSAHISDEELAAQTAWHIRERHSWEALQYAWDRIYGRPRQSVEVETSEGNPLVVAMERQALAWEAMARLAAGEAPAPAPPYTLIEAPISQDKAND